MSNMDFAPLKRKLEEAKPSDADEEGGYCEKESYKIPFQIFWDEGKTVDELIQILREDRELPEDIWFLGLADGTEPLVPQVIVRYLQTDVRDIKNKKEDTLRNWMEKEICEKTGSYQFSVEHISRIGDLFNGLRFSKKYRDSLNDLCKCSEVRKEGALYIFSPMRYLQTVIADINEETHAMNLSRGEEYSKALTKTFAGYAKTGLLTSDSTEKDYIRFWPYLYGELPQKMNDTPFNKDYNPIMLPIPIRIGTGENGGCFLMYNTCLKRKLYEKPADGGIWPGAPLDRLCDYYQEKQTGAEAKPFCYRIPFDEKAKGLLIEKLHE